MVDLDDERLMACVQRDEPGAFRALYDRHAAGALSVARAVTTERAQDAVQDAFVCVWRDRRRYRHGAGSVHGWIVTITRRRALDLVRQDARRVSPATPAGLEDLAAPESLEDDAIARADAVRLRIALRGLPGFQREVIALAFFGGLTHREIAARLAVPEGTVKGRMRLGLDRLRGGWAAPEGSGPPSG